MEIPLVSICCVTYNHENHLRQCLEGFVMQKTNFFYEILVHEDASKDNTAKILREFEAHYRDRFRCVFQTENQFYKQNVLINILFKMARGKYIALCEGDDYWTDPLKLQKQVDFLAENPEYGLVCGGFNCINHLTDERNVFYHNPLIDNTTKGSDITTDSLMERWNVQALTATFNADLLDIDGFKKYSFFCDVHLFYLLIMKKKGFYFNEILALQNVHETGVFSHKKYIEKQIFLYNARKDLWLFNKEQKGMQRKVFHATSELFANSFDPDYKAVLNHWQLLFDMFRTMQDFGDFKHIVKCVTNQFARNSK